MAQTLWETRNQERTRYILALGAKDPKVQNAPSTPNQAIPILSLADYISMMSCIGNPGNRDSSQRTTHNMLLQLSLPHPPRYVPRTQPKGFQPCLGHPTMFFCKASRFLHGPIRKFCCRATQSIACCSTHNRRYNARGLWHAGVLAPCRRSFSQRVRNDRRTGLGRYIVTCTEWVI